MLRLRTEATDVVVKASDTSHHISREIRAYRRMSAPLAGRTPELLHADAEARIVVTSWLPGVLVEGRAAEFAPDLYRQAGELLARLHSPAETNDGYDGAVLHKIGDLTARASGLIPARHLDAVEGLLAAHRRVPRTLYATHGDFHPRNWMVHDGRLFVIDYGRAGYRPWVSDLVRLEHQQFVGRPGLRAAFYAGYGSLPEREPASWRLDNVLQSLGTVVWAHDVGDAAFEAQGRDMLSRILAWWA